MLTDTAPQEKAETRKATMAPWRIRCREAGVTHDHIAAAYGCTRPFVVNVFAGRSNAPEGFVAVIERLCRKREARGRRARNGARGRGR